MPPKGDPDVRRPKPRRLFSLESLKSSSTRNSSSDHELPPLGAPVNPFDLSDVQEVDDEHEQTIYAPMAVRSVTEPSPRTAPFAELESTQGRGATSSRSRLEPVRPIAITAVPLRALPMESTQSTPSPGRARWESLRQHVIPNSSRPATPPQRPPSAQSSIISNLPARSHTPKPSRLAKLGFRHVVEHVVEQAKDVMHDTKKLGEEVQRACSMARYPEYVKPSRDGSTNGSSGGTMGSSLIASGKMSDYLRRPQSVSATSLPPANAPGSQLPSLRFLYQILLQHATESPASNIINLPFESHVLSTLLCPFLTPGKYMRPEEEQMTSVETFELLANRWAPVDEAATVGRVVWCTRATASLQGSDTRTRILGSLWRLLVPATSKILLSPAGFHSISCNLLLLLAALYRSTGIPASSTNPYMQSPIFKTSIGYSFSSANFKHPPHPDINLLQDLIPQFLSASLGEVEDDKIEETYAVLFSVIDRRNVARVRHALFSESLVMTIENAPGTGEWLLCNAVERYWPILSPDTWSTLQAAISCRKINSFCRSSFSVLKPFIAYANSGTTPDQISRLPSTSSTGSSMNDFSQSIRNVAIPSEIVHILESRAIPEAELLDKDTEMKQTAVDETRKLVASIVLRLGCLNTDIDDPQRSSRSGVDVFGIVSSSFSSGNEIESAVKWSISTICRWYEPNNQGPWKAALEQAFTHIISQDWIHCIPVLFVLLTHLPDNIRKPIFTNISVPLNDQLIEHPPPYPSPAVSEFLTAFSRSPPPIAPIFFKPLFACAASDKEVVVMNHLCTLQAHSAYVEDYWTRDVDMISFALLGSAKDLKSHDSPDIWGVARLGQLVLLVELIGQMQTLRHRKESHTHGEGSFNDSVRFAMSLEARVWSMIEFQERNQQIPPSLRMLLYILFRELRLLTRSLKPAPWLSRTLQWFHTYCGADYNEDLEEDVSKGVERIQGLYLAAQAAIQDKQKRHTSILSPGVYRSPTPVVSAEETGKLDLAAIFVKHRKLIDSLSKGYISKSLKLFVAMSSLISSEDSVKLAPLLWQNCLLDNIDSSLTASACFMLMQCTEKAPMEVRPMIELDMQSSDDVTRLEAVRKISILINWRFQLMNQQFISDRNHRPFKLARPPLPFIATDIGSSLFILTDDQKETRNKDDVPPELKRRLAELGFAEDDRESIDPRHEIIRTPFSILPIQQWDRQEVGTTDIGTTSPLPSPHPSPRKQREERDHGQLSQTDGDLGVLLRRNSSSGGPSHGIKRRAVFVPALTLIFLRLCTLVSDPDFAVASAARITILDLMRNDPALLTRPILELLAGEARDVKLAMSTFTALLHVRRMLPPAVTHIIFNNLAGFLKLLAREEKAPDALDDFGQILPIMVNIATQVSGMSMREIRRAKIDHFIVPTGSLWFSSTAPKGSMFPRSLGSSENPFEPVSSRLVSITMIRVAQNIFFLTMLKRNPQDVQIVRKNMTTLTLPSLDEEGFCKTLELQDFMPRKFIPDTRPSIRNGEVELLSLMVARSSTMLVAQIFRSMPRHLSDRNELATLVDGLNRALLVHGDDINIISHALIALMVATTRFRRLFTAGGGYTLFLPALVKVYSENPSHPGIRSAIEYSLKKFYALHKDSFLYQAINITGQICMLPQIDSSWFSKAVYDLFSSLRRGVSESAVNVGGIFNANRFEEREALILHTADEKPQAFLAAIKRTESDSGRHMSLQLPEQYESHKLDMPDFVKLFLTIIAHDLSIARAQHFLRLLLLLTPHLYNTSSKTKTVLSDGIDALGQILNKAYSKPKASENIKPAGRDDEGALLNSTGGLQEKGKNMSDSKTLRIDYLRLINSFGSSGGQVTLAMVRYAFDVVRSLVKDWGDTDITFLAQFLDDFLKMLLNRPDHASPKAIVAFLQELTPLLRLPVLSCLDLTGVYKTILKFTEIPTYSSDSHFCRVVVEDVCAAGLQACETASKENALMNMSYRPVLISLLSESIFLKGRNRDIDIISQLEKLPPTYQNLSAIFLPLTLTMKTENQVIANGLMNDYHRLVLSEAWVRILFFAMTACQNGRKDADGTRQLRGIASSFTRLKSSGRERQDGFWRSHLPTLMTALQVIKVIIIRGPLDITFVPQLAIWERLADFFKSMLSEGSADFALRTDPSSAATTPTASPRSSSQFDLSNSTNSLFVSTSSDLSRPSSSLSHSMRPLTLHRPRIIDYSLWSVLEFACAYRSPLRMLLKVLTMEKVVSLDQALLHQAWSKGGSSPVPHSASSRRVSTSLFSKTRQRNSGFLGPSPESSPRLTPSSSLMPSPSFLDIPKLDLSSRRPGYQVSPVTPYDRPAGIPKIVHLGPVSPSGLSPNISPMIGGLKASKSMSSGAGSEGDGDVNVAKATKIRSLKLIHETYRRIRGVQVYMGYELLLPIPGTLLSRGKDEEAGLETWTTSQALRAIVDETKDLLEEFEESFALEGDSVFVEADQTMLSYPNSPTR